MRPYYDSEINEAMKRLLKEEQFLYFLKILFPDEDFGDVVQKFQAISSTYEFQSMFSHRAVRETVRRTSEGLTFSGLDKLDTQKPYLFIANHRDIVLDSAMMQVLLLENKHKTSEITFGSNLMYNQFVIDLGKANKMFTIYREGTKLQLYKHAVLHSKYIRKTLAEKHESVWIAQRDGRTKDGNDKTNEALIKMLLLGNKNLVESAKELNIVPVTVSYEYEPCDIQKTREVYLSKKEKYVKKKGEDHESIVKGFTSYKGHIHMNFGTPINSLLSDSTANIENEFVPFLLKEIDKQVYLNYKLWPNNYIAYDLLQGNNEYADKNYTVKQKKAFEEYIEVKASEFADIRSPLIEGMINLYATPLINRLKCVANNL